MSTSRILNGPRNRLNRIVLFSLVVLMLVALAATMTVTARQARAAGAACVGTYLVEESGGVVSLWTFSRDRTLQTTSSAEDAANFTHSQGAWRRDSRGTVTSTALDFPVDGVFPPATISRVDASMTFSNNCRDMAGSLDLRIYDATTEDPLNIVGEPIVLSDTFTGRRVIVP